METQKATAKVRSATENVKLNNAPGRLLYIDNLRWLMIIFVVLIHLNCTYGNLGRWYYQEAGPRDGFSQAVFSMFGSFTQAYFMGFLFLIAGYFVPGSCDKKGGGRFIGERLQRLGIPTLVFMVLLHPFTILIIRAFNHCLPLNLPLWYGKYLVSFDFIEGSGPLWFALALLIFSIIYVLFRFVFPKAELQTGRRKIVLLTNFRIGLLTVLMALATFLIRLFQPIGTAIFNMQLCYFAQYIILFALGIIAYRRDLLSKLPTKLGKFWFRFALGLGIPLWLALMKLGGALDDWTPFTGGFHWQAAAYAIWESFFCIGICLGLLVLFREKYNRQGPLSRFLAANAFGVYVFHTPLLVAATLLVRNIAVYPFLKMILMSVIILPACFGFSHLLRKLSLLRNIFS